MEKQLPHSTNAERAVLGSILIDPEVIGEIADILRMDDLYHESHRIIYEAALRLLYCKTPTDFQLVSSELESTNKLEQIGGMTYLVGLLNDVPTSTNAVYYADIVKKKAQYRAVIHACGFIAGEAYNENEQVFALSQERFFQIGQGETGSPVVSHIDALSRYWSVLEELHEQHSTGVLPGVPTGYRKLNDLLGGFRTSKLYILAGRPGEGKTALALNFAYEAIKQGGQVLFFSIEMDEDELMQRLVAVETKVDSLHLRDAKLSPEEWERVVDGMARLLEMRGRLWVDNTPANSIEQMRAKARKMLGEHGLDLIIVDYLQLAKATTAGVEKAENRRLEVERVSRELREMARELKVPVLALAQLNRDVESRANRVPQLSDLREAGGIEQDCDVAMFIYRDPVVPKEAPEYDISLLIEKHRNGPKGNVALHFVGAQTRFYPIEKALEVQS